MARELRVDTNQLGRQAAALNRTASEFHNTIQSLRRDLAGMGVPWGHDEISRAFAKQFLPVREKTFKVADKVATALKDGGEGLLATHRVHVNAANEATDTVRKLL